MILDSLTQLGRDSFLSPQEQEVSPASRRQEPLFENRLFYGDNLRILRNPVYVRRESVDLVYLDPPFKPTEKYNVLFRARSGTPAAAQVRAFEDTWHWDEAAVQAYHDTREHAPHHVGRTLEALRIVVAVCDMFAYLCMMAPRLVEMHRALKPTGSLYLHCDPAASHYLKVLVDAVFGPTQFQNEIVWKRSSAHNDPLRYGRVHDTLLFYTKGSGHTWNQQFDPTDAAFYAAHDFERDENGRLYRKRDLTAPAHGRNSGQYEWKGRRPPKGRMWSFTRENMERLEAEQRVVYTRTGMPRLKIYDEDLRGIPYQDVWSRPDLWLNSAAVERLGYPTQKPTALLERIIQSSSNPGDLVLDPFCGCGTTIEAAQRLGRMWIGIDITYDAIRIVRDRLGSDADYRVYGDPASVEDAETLARQDPYQFQWWAVRRLGAREVEQKKGADKGIDGRLFLRSEHFAEAIISVKAGHTGPAHVRELHGTLVREKAAVGVLVTLRKPTAAMRAAAGAADSFTDGERWYPRIQILTAADIIAGKGVEYPTEAIGAPQPVRESKPTI